MSSLGSNPVDPVPGVPDPLDGDARSGEPGGGIDPGRRPGEFDGLDGPDEDGPFYAWLPPEDRLWRHPSERVEGAPGASGPPRVDEGELSRRWAGILPKALARSTWAVALIAGLVGASAATGIGVASGLWPHDTTVVRSLTPSTPTVSLAAVGPGVPDWASIDDSVAGSVVTVSVNGAGVGPEVGSGLVFLQSTAGVAYIATDRSLFARGQAAGYMGPIEVTFPSGNTTRGTLIGEDPLSGLAVVRISGPAAAGATPANLGSIASLHEADAVLAVGSRTTSLSPGLISGEDRTVALSDGTDIDGLLAVSMPSLAVTAMGGPLVDQFGQVIGLTVGVEPIDEADTHLTFALPIDEVSRIASEFINGSRPTHPWLGVTNAEDVPSAMAQKLGLVVGGVQAVSVAAQGPAGLAGLRANDVVTAFDGKAVASAGALMAQVDSCIPGHAVPMTYIQDGRTVSTMVKVGDEPQDG